MAIATADDDAAHRCATLAAAAEEDRQNFAIRLSYVGGAIGMR